jgi:hypothetical protein
MKEFFDLFTQAYPYNPMITRVRTDLDWDMGGYDQEENVFRLIHKDITDFYETNNLKPENTGGRPEMSKKSDFVQFS